MKIDYYAYRSGMRKWNAGFKVLLSVAILCLVIGLNHIGVSLFVVVTMGILTLVVGRLPGKIYLHYMTIPLTFMLISGLMIAIEFAGQPLGSWNLNLQICYICVTGESLRTAVQVFFKALAGVSALYMMAFSTPMSEFISVLQKLHLPTMLVELMHLIYRYIFILLDVANAMQTAAKARLGYRNLKQGFHTFAGIAGNLFLISLCKANVYYDAMVARGYDGRLEFLTERYPVNIWQVAGAVVYFAAIAGICFWAK